MNLEKMIAVRNRKTIYRDGDKTVKVFETGYAMSEILNEALNQSRMQESGLLVPSVYEVVRMDSKVALIYQFIEGKSLAQMMFEHPEKYEDYMRFMVDLQLKIQNLNVPLLSSMRDKLHLKIGAADLMATVRYDLHRKLDSMPVHKKVCHCDFNPANVIITAEGDAYVIDWAHVVQGNASVDAAFTYLKFLLAGEDDHAEMYINIFCEKSGIPRSNIEKWIPIVAAAKSVTSNSANANKLLKMATRKVSRT